MSKVLIYSNFVILDISVGRAELLGNSCNPETQHSLSEGFQDHSIREEIY
jgi:hypothetical protein